MRGPVYKQSQAPSWVLSLRDGLRQTVFLAQSTKTTDLGGLTLFPNPGESRQSFKELTTNLELNERRGPITDKSDIMCSNVITSDCQSRIFWMPDRLCKSCYECELQFNMFRRRHHCRFCGQVFCHSCASFFVDGKSVFLSGIVRACKLCHDQVSSAPVTITRPNVPITRPNVPIKAQFSNNRDLVSASASSTTLNETSHKSLAYSRSVGSRFEEPGNSAANDLQFKRLARHGFAAGF
jgi:1-phosphatidylinositol-3-phosphate 5-kinase